MESNNVAPDAAMGRPRRGNDDEERFELVGIETAPQRAIGRVGSRLLSFFGLLLVGVGATMAASPYLSWQVSEVTALLAKLGVQSGAVALSGLVLMGVGGVGRSLSRLAERPRITDNGMVDAVGRMADQVSLLAGTLSHLHEQVTNLALRDPIIQVDAPPPDADLMNLYRDQKDAVFQLAASLDKLGRQVSEQLAKELKSMESQFDGLRRNIEESETRVSEKLQHAAASTPAAPAARSSTTPSAPEPAPVARGPQVQDFSDSMPLPTEIELEEPHPEVEPEVSPLAFLEGLKHIEPPSQNPHSPSVATPALDFDQLDLTSGANRVDGPPAALPGTPVDQNLNHGQHTQR